MGRIKIEVTDEDIRTGTPNSCLSCPITKAVMRALNKENSVDERVIAVYDYTGGGVRTKCFPLSRNARKFVRDFDARKKVKPFYFFLKE